MKWLKKLFRKEKEAESVPPMPSWDRIVEMLYDKGLDSFCDEVVNVIYSKDKSMRYVILRDEKGIYTYQIEAVYQFDEDDWKYICSQDNALPATWDRYFLDHHGKSLFDTEEDLMKEIRCQPEFKQFFE